MAQIANIVVKKANDTADVTYTAVTGSAGDDSPAIWRNNAVGVKVNQRPELRLSSKGTANGRRASKMNFVYPVMETTPAGDVVIDYITIVVDAKVTQNATEATIAEAVYQGLNLAGSLLIKQSITSGFAPRS